MSTVSPDYDVLVDEWALPGLSPASRRKIKSELWKAHATFHQSAYNGPFRFVKPMQQAFTAIAGVLFDAGLLSVEVLEKQLPLFILESAITGNWDVDYFVTNETRTKIFPGYLGHAATWKRFNQSLGNIFEAESAEWKSKLLGAESREDMPKSGSVAPPPVPATKRGRRALVDEFIIAVSDSTGRTITRRDIWTAAGYSHATEFERFQRNATRTTSSARNNFSRVLNMKPEDFLRLLDKKRPRK